MSKTRLKKELAALDKDQLMEVILDAYAARKEIKEYFDFYIDPDQGRLIEKYEKLIAKEFSRSKWGSSKARTSHISKYLKEFASFNPDGESIVTVHLFAVTYAILTEYSLRFSDTQLNALKKMILKALELGDRHGESSRVIETFDKMLGDSAGCSRLARRIMRESIEQYAADASVIKS